MQSARHRSGAIPSTIHVPYATWLTGLSYYDPTTAAGTKTYLHASASSGTIGPSHWVGEVTGTDCYLHASNSNGDAQTNFIEVSVDGGAYASVTGVADVFPVFTGLPNAKHTVAIRINSIYGTSYGWVVPSGTTMDVTGTGPICAPAQVTYTPAASVANVACTGVFSATPTNYTPASATNTGALAYSSPTGIMFKAATSRMILGLGTFNNYAFVSVDGGAAVAYHSANGGLVVVQTDPGLHTYNVWGVGWCTVGIDAAFQTLATPKRLHQYGDSITFGTGATNSGYVETNTVAAALGMIGCNIGKGGQTVEGLYADLSTILAYLTTDNTQDVAVLTIGRNNTGAGWTSTTNTDYAAIITALLARYKKVICRGLINDGSVAGAPNYFTTAPWTTENGYIQTLVANAANANVTYVDPTAWTDVQTVEGTHPTNTGYATLVGHCVTGYTGKI